MRCLLLQLLLKSVQNPLKKNQLLRLVKRKFKLKVSHFNTLFDFSIVYYNLNIRIRHCYFLSLRPTYRGTCQMKTSPSSITRTQNTHTILNFLQQGVSIQLWQVTCRSYCVKEKGSQFIDINPTVMYTAPLLYR
jgi:hypothetical protein